MVQRKVIKKHGEDDGRKSSDALRSVKSSSLHNGEGRNRGPEFKKMKREGPVKQAGPAFVPNYMKSTSSSVARKEQSRVSVRRPQAVDGVGGVSGLKKVRALRKNLSFKPGRCLVKKCTTVVLGENLDARRGTCSSTLKDCKHPAYLLLNQGGTEAEGTSAVKVCPYTYCSLNGHHHAPLPPLKAFLLSRRCLLKTQRNEKFQKNNGELGSSTSLSETGQNDFFIEIYCGDGGSVANCGIDKTVTDITLAQDYEQVTESISVPSIGTCVDLNEIPDENNDEYATDMDSDEYLDEKVDAIWDEFSADIFPGDQLDELDSEPCDMSCEAYEDVDYEYLPNNDKESDFRPVDSCSGEFPANQASQETINKEITISETSTANGDCESVVSFEHGDCCNDLTPVEEQDGVPEPAYYGILPEALKSNPQTSDSGTGYEAAEFLNDPAKEMAASIDSMVAEKNPTEGEGHTFLVATDSYVTAKSDTQGQCLDASASGTGAFLGQTPDQDVLADDRFSKETRTPMRPIQQREEEGQFNPREPNFLPLTPAPEAEKVDLRHQELDEKRNAEEWMVDFALRQTVTKLGPARKKKVALLVEAFEKVLPATKCEVQLRRTSAFDHERPIQACN